MKKLLSLFISAVFAGSVFGEVVRPAPNFTWGGINGSSKALSSLVDQPVILIIAPSPKSGVFKKQLKNIERLYRQYAGREVLIVAAFTREPGVVESDVPFLYATDPQTTAASYGLGVGKFEVAVIGPDRNIDLVTNNVVTGERIRDVIDNGYVRQVVRRK